MNPAWPFPDPFPALAAGEVHVWRRSLPAGEGALASHFAILSADEQERANQFKVNRPRDQFVLTRATLRFLIGKYLNVTPGELRFHLSEQGKPSLLHPPAKLEFNVSHSHELALFAFSKNAPVGIDVEWLGRKVAYADIAERFFSDSEQAQLNDVPEADRHRAFLECWTRKEAYLKARGLGLSRDPRTFSVSLGSETHAQLREDQHDPSTAQSWQIHPLQPHRDYCGAVAVKAGERGMKVLCHW